MSWRRLPWPKSGATEVLGGPCVEFRRLRPPYASHGEVVPEKNDFKNRNWKGRFNLLGRGKRSPGELAPTRMALSEPYGSIRRALRGVRSATTHLCVVVRSLRIKSETAIAKTLMFTFSLSFFPTNYRPPPVFAHHNEVTKILIRNRLRLFFRPSLLRAFARIIFIIIYVVVMQVVVGRRLFSCS